MSHSFAGPNLMDLELLYLFNRTWTSPALDWTMAVASCVAVWMPFLILAGGLLLIFGSFRVRAFIICVGLTMGLLDGLSSKSLKKAVGRPRPNDVRADVRMVDVAKASPRLLALAKPLKIKMARPSSERPVGGNSFPSSHVVNNFAAATLAIVFFRRWGWLALLPAGLVAYSRIYVGAHYPSDVLVSIFLAAGQALLLFLLFAWAWKKLAPRLFPKAAEAHPTLLT
jgi:undecaprenyl-diphosphatase